MSLEGAVVHVSLHPGPSPSKCIVSFAVGPPMLVDFSSDSAKQLPAFIMGTPSLWQRLIGHAQLAPVLDWVLSCSTDEVAPMFLPLQYLVLFGPI